MLLNPTITQSDCHIIQLPSSSPAPVSATPAASLATTGTQTTTTTSQHLEISSPTHVATMQSPTFPRNGKNSEISTTRASTGEISQKITVFSSPTPSATSSDSSTTYTASTAFETRSKTIDFTQKHKNGEILPILSQFTSKTPTPSTVGPTKDIMQAYASPITTNDAIFHPLTLSSPASSSQPPVLPADIGYEKASRYASFSNIRHLQSPQNLPPLFQPLIVRGFQTRAGKAHG